MQDDMVMKTEMVRAQTRTGFACEVPKENFDNWDLVNAAAASGKGDSTATIEYVRIMLEEVLGEDVAGRLKDHVSVGGRVPMSALVSECNDIAAAVKN